MNKLVVCLALALASVGAVAGEGMWTPDNLPKARVQANHGFTPDAKWAEHVQKAALRLAGGCSGSFVSPNGLVLTNHHCINACVQQLSSAEHDYIKHGFFAKEAKDELRCPEIELNRLDRISDVTARVKAATAGKSGEAYSKAEKAIKSAIEKECAGKDSARTRCDVVDLYHGGVFSLYQYHRIQDVRLAFAPELEAAFFGGDPDNFNFPRYDLDMGLLRAYENGKPVRPKDYFPFSKDGAAEGEMTVIVGNPGGTDRQLTVAQLELARDDELVSYLLFLAERRGLLTQFRNENAENWRVAQSDLFATENSYKVLRGRLSALQDPTVFNLKRAQETELRDFVAADPARQRKYGAAWDEIAEAVAVERNNLDRDSYLEGGRGFYTRYYDYARMLVRGAAERNKPDAERLREFTDSKLPALTQRLFSTAPIYANYEQVKFGWSLTKLRETLGTGDAFVKKVLGNESPEALAKRLVEGSKLGDPAVRKALWDGGADAIAKSDDPFIVLARAVDGDARAIRARYENEVESVIDSNSALIAAARFEKYGTSVYPDATFTQRFSFGEVKGWDEKGVPVEPFTTIGGAFEHATGAYPFALPQSWLDAKAKGALNLAQRYNFVSSNDIIGGNSGSPVINGKAQVVGLVFDGNIHSLGGNYWYDERLNRTVSVHSGAIIETLRNVYHADRLVDEIEAAGKR
ncbi:MAG: S46 family peptidase [Dokdonella sp.]|uniref:S46 family peptidase n=1 Tax=Dokdonella sp. TaxID=2291710 RepID=UPI0025BA6810|nr:S46 family peptidase [Dokdonella sp.]MBX3699585.1 S46 family peptidase [Dokdonella sp.]